MRVIRLLMCICMLGMIGCAKASEDVLPSTEESPVKLVFGTDLHYISPSLTDNGEAFQKLMNNGDGKYLVKCEEITEAFIDKCIREQPDAVLLGGDLTFNGAAQSHADLIMRLRRIENAGIPVLVIPGNHDLGAYADARFEGDQYTLVRTMDAAEFKEEYAQFGYDEAFMRCEDSFSYAYALRRDLWILALDANSNTTGLLGTETLTFAQEVQDAAEKQGVKLLVMTHQNVLLHQTFVPGMQIYDADILKKILKPENVLLCMSGHMHIQHVRTEDGFTEAATSALSITPLHYAAVTLDGHTLTYQAKCADETLAEEAHAYFVNIAYEKTRKNLLERYDEDTASGMAETFTEINTAYFEGRNDPALFAEGTGKWSIHSDMMAVYLNSVLEEMKQGQDHCYFTLTY